MKTLDELKDRIALYQGARTFRTDFGFIVWQITTGENIEILFISVVETGKGLGTALVKDWVAHLIAEGQKPFHSVMVTRLESNTEAGRFYGKLGFTEHSIADLYKVRAVLSTISFEKLCQNLSIS